MNTTGESSKNSSPSPRSRIVAWMVKTADSRRVELTPERVRIYCERLEHHPPNQIDAALRQAAADCKWFPSIAEIIQRMPPPRNSVSEILRENGVPEAWTLRGSAKSQPGAERAGLAAVPEKANRPGSNSQPSSAVHVGAVVRAMVKNPTTSRGGRRS